MQRSAGYGSCPHFDRFDDDVSQPLPSRTGESKAAAFQRQLLPSRHGTAFVMPSTNIPIYEQSRNFGSSLSVKLPEPTFSPERWESPSPTTQFTSPESWGENGSSDFSSAPQEKENQNTRSARSDRAHTLTLNSLQSSFAEISCADPKSAK